MSGYSLASRGDTPVESATAWMPEYDSTNAAAMRSSTPTTTAASASSRSPRWLSVGCAVPPMGWLLIERFILPHAMQPQATGL